VAWRSFWQTTPKPRESKPLTDTKTKTQEIGFSTEKNSNNMYILKVKGKAKIPDYIQIRDDNFVLVAYFRADRPLKNIEKFGFEGKEEALEALIKDLPFGKPQKLEL
jgi:hypothetical protein